MKNLTADMVNAGLSNADGEDGDDRAAEELPRAALSAPDRALGPDDKHNAAAAQDQDCECAGTVPAGDPGLTQVSSNCVCIRRCVFLRKGRVGELADGCASADSDIDSIYDIEFENCDNAAE